LRKKTNKTLINFYIMKEGKKLQEALVPLEMNEKKYEGMLEKSLDQNKELTYLKTEIKYQRERIEDLRGNMNDIRLGKFDLQRDQT
jgi:hypothetical protein